MNDFGCSVLITADEGWRNGKTVPLKVNSDEALEGASGVTTCVVVNRTGNDVPWTEGRVAAQPAECEPEAMDAEDLLYVLYTSGTTGKPKGIVHTTGGYLTGVAPTHRFIFDIHEHDVDSCAADTAWAN